MNTENIRKRQKPKKKFQIHETSESTEFSMYGMVSACIYLWARATRTHTRTQFILNYGTTAMTSESIRTHISLAL